MKFKKALPIALSAMIACGSSLAPICTSWNAVPMTAFADEVIPLGTYDKITYYSYIDYATVAKVDPSLSGTVTIPAEIKGLPVLHFDGNVFNGCSKITKLVLSHNFQCVWYNNLSSCTNLKEIEINNPSCMLDWDAIPPNVTIYGFENSTAQQYAKDFGNKFVALDASLAPPSIDNNSGSCGAQGDNVTWTLDSDGTLTISGDGDMKNWDFGESVWYSNYNIKEVIIEDGVTNIGSLAFHECRNISSITISDSVISIGNNAFNRCDELKSIKLSESVVNIEDKAFNDCYLNDITFKNPDCNIYDSEKTISNTITTIYGYRGSTAQAYAEKYNRTFISLGNKPAAVETGDVNSDGIIDSSDASSILDEYALAQTGAETVFNEAQKLAADVNKDGCVDSVDASKILAYYADSATGNEPSWD